MTKHDTFIRELKELHVTVFTERETTYNSGLIYSVIDELVSIKRTARGSMSQSFRLRDPSWTLPNYKRGVSITLFHKEDGAIANDAQVGDILIVHDVQVCGQTPRIHAADNKQAHESIKVVLYRFQIVETENHSRHGFSVDRKRYWHC
ncbi:hypothetical protein K492DRAFT_199347 [Lichtheimia hyalospora FSU 10163]|nr:hypothetical protein K492DRAFT_199347 [Lichtheimia hyalospora FSU 10163]